MSTDRSFRWVPLIGALAALIIIWMVHQQTQQANTALQATFAQQAALKQTEISLSKTVTALTPQPEMPQIGLDDLQRLMPTALAGLPNIPSTFTAGPTPIVTGTVGGLLVEVLELAPLPDGGQGVMVVGRVSNIGQAEMTVPISAFELIDTAGASYAADGAQAVLKPNEFTPLELRVPLPPERGLKMRVSLPNAEPLEMELRDETLPPGAPA